MAEEERNRAEKELLKHESELDSAQREHAAVRQKLLALEKKIIVGGEKKWKKNCDGRCLVLKSSSLSLIPSFENCASY